VASNPSRSGKWPVTNDERKQFTPRLVVAVWLGVGFALAVRTVISPVIHSVFPLFAASADHFWNNQPLYGNYKPLDYFRYPPVFAVFVTPLSVLGLRAGGILWCWLNLGIYGWGVARFGLEVLPAKSWSQGRWSLYLLLALAGAIRGLWNSQSNPLAVGLLLLGSAEVVQRRNWRAGLLLASAVSLKLTPLAAVLLLCALVGWSLAGRLAVGIAAILVIPFLCAPVGKAWRDHEEWLSHLVGSSNERWPGFRDAWTIWMVGRQAWKGDGQPLVHDAPVNSSYYRAIQLTAAALALAWCLKHRRNGKVEARCLAVALALGLGWLTLFGPAVEHATYAFLAPALAWAVVEPGQRVRVRLLGWVAALLVMFLGWRQAVQLFPSWTWLEASLPLGSGLFILWALLVEQQDTQRTMTQRNLRRCLDRPAFDRSASTMGTTRIGDKKRSASELCKVC
jgi:hypothetical protein